MIKQPVNHQVIAHDAIGNRKKCPIRVQLKGKEVGIYEAQEAIDKESYGKLSLEQQSQYLELILMKMMGTANEEAARYLIMSILQVISEHERSDFVYNSILQLIHGIEPADPLEAMLALQAIALYVQGMKYLGRIDVSKQNLTVSVKLLRLQHETIEKLDRLRRKGEQRVIVQHVQVNEGGKAIVGNILPGGG